MRHYQRQQMMLRIFDHFAASAATYCCDEKNNRTRLLGLNHAHATAIDVHHTLHAAHVDPISSLISYTVRLNV